MVDLEHGTKLQEDELSIILNEWKDYNSWRLKCIREALPNPNTGSPNWEEDRIKKPKEIESFKISMNSIHLVSNIFEERFIEFKTNKTIWKNLPNF